ncbi:MAG: hypothetical protein AB7T22_09640 [Calditrichaceae bacterium]
MKLSTAFLVIFFAAFSLYGQEVQVKEKVKTEAKEKVQLKEQAKTAEKEQNQVKEEVKTQEQAKNKEMTQTKTKTEEQAEVKVQEKVEEKAQIKTKEQTKEQTGFIDEDGDGINDKSKKDEGSQFKETNRNQSGEGTTSEDAAKQIQKGKK